MAFMVFAFMTTFDGFLCRSLHRLLHGLHGLRLHDDLRRLLVLHGTTALHGLHWRRICIRGLLLLHSTLHGLHGSSLHGLSAHSLHRSLHGLLHRGGHCCTSENRSRWVAKM